MVHFGLIGYPLGHSLSPRLHTAALQELKLEGDYELFPVSPLPESARSFGELFERLRSGRLNGLNVTIPHKQSVIAWLDELTPVARSVGAVNTIFRKQERLVGDNTDVPGFIADLKEVMEHGGRSAEPDPKPCTFHALVLGAGGAARAVSFALDYIGWSVTMAARRLEQAEELVKSMKLVNAINQEITVVMLNQSSIGDIKSEIRLVVNTTPLGMAPNVDANPWPNGLTFPQRALVYDLVYNPPETALLRAAKAAGLYTTNGLGMLVEQAALSFERWTGQPAPRQAMRKAVTVI